MFYKRIALSYAGFSFAQRKMSLCNLDEIVGYTKSKSPYLLFLI